VRWAAFAVDGHVGEPPEAARTTEVGGLLPLALRTEDRRLRIASFLVVLALLMGRTLQQKRPLTTRACTPTKSQRCSSTCLPRSCVLPENLKSWSSGPIRHVAGNVSPLLTGVWLSRSPRHAATRHCTAHSASPLCRHMPPRSTILPVLCLLLHPAIGDLRDMSVTRCPRVVP